MSTTTLTRPLRQLKVEEFDALLRAQGVEKEHLAFKCIMCGTVQSIASFVRAGLKAEEAERFIGFSCIGRWTSAGPHEPGRKPGKGCDWTLGGLFRIHKLEMIDAEGKAHPCFEPSSPEEAKALKLKHTKKP